jgi:hypothetical protein
MRRTHCGIGIRRSPGSLGVQAPAAGSTASVYVRARWLFSDTISGRQYALGLETVKRRIQVTLIDAKRLTGHLTDALLDIPAVIRSEREGLENRSRSAAPCRYSVLDTVSPLVSRQRTTPEP